MTNTYDVLVSARDAEALASVVGDHNHEADATNALADVVMEARLVPHHELPVNRVAMNSRVTYRDATGAERSVFIVHPREADPSVARISVLSPIGRALLGRKRGSTIEASLPGGRATRLHILGVEHAS
jgi:regulator of nucleoside diphosphate kinase